MQYATTFLEKIYNNRIERERLAWKLSIRLRVVNFTNLFGGDILEANPPKKGDADPETEA